MFGGEHKQTDIAQSAIFTTGSMRASRFYPAILLSFLILYGDYSFDLSSKIRIISSYIFSPFTQIEYLAKDSFNSFDSYFSSQKKLSEEMISAAKVMNFELAASYRDRLKAITKIHSIQGINPEKIKVLFLASNKFAI